MTKPTYEELLAALDALALRAYGAANNCPEGNKYAAECREECERAIALIRAAQK